MRVARTLFFAVARVVGVLVGALFRVAYRLVIAAGLVAAAIVAAVVLAPLIVSQVLSPANCVGEMSPCYQAWRMPDAMKRERIAVLPDFAASAKAIAFRVILDNEEHGLLFIDRGTGQSVRFRYFLFDERGAGPRQRLRTKLTKTRNSRHLHTFVKLAYMKE